MPTPNNSWRRKRKRRLWKEQHGKCYWCGEDMIRGSQPPGKSPIRKLATLDHLRHRFDPSRLEANFTGEQRLVLACYECNQRRGREDYVKYADTPLLSVT